MRLHRIALLLCGLLALSACKNTHEADPMVAPPTNSNEPHGEVLPPTAPTTFAEAYAAGLVTFASTEARDVVFFEQAGLFAVWYDPSARISRATVHWYTEYPQGEVDGDVPVSNSWTQSGYPASVPASSRAKSDAYKQTDHHPDLGPFERGHLVENAAFRQQSKRNLTFRTFNCVPEVDEFNAPLWAGLELASREAVNTNTTVAGEMALVLTGVVADEATARRIPLRGALVDQGVVVPTVVWRVVYLCGTDRTVDSVRTWVRWQKPEGQIGHFDENGDGQPDEFSVQQVEALAGIDLP